MPRGRKPLIALSEAKHIAERRGEVRHFRHEPDMICSFVIYMIGLVAHVRVRRVERIRITADWLDRVAAEDLAALRFNCIFAGNLPRALDLYAQRIVPVLPGAENSLVELDRSGNPLPGQPPVPARTMPAPAAAWAEKSGGPEPAPGSPGSAVSVPVFLLPACTPETVDPPTAPVGEKTFPESIGEEGK